MTPIPRLRATATLAALALVLGASPGARADSGNAGLSVGSFLAVPPGAAVPGMAGATLALTGDLSAATMNPALLGSLPSLVLGLSHSELPDGSRHEWASAGGTLGAVPTRWALSGLYVGQGTFDGRDALNQPTGSFTASSAALGLAIAQPLGGRATLGLGAKWVSENLAGVTGSGVTLDAGVVARAGAFGLAASAQNVGGTINYGGVRYSFPITYGVGASIEHPSGLRLEVDANFPYDYYRDVRAGVEYRWHDRVALRGGYRYELGSDPATEPLNGPTFGLGAGTRGVWLDYAYQPSMIGDTEHRLGIVLVPARWQWSGGALEAKPEDAPR